MCRLAGIQARALAAVESARADGARLAAELEALRQQFRAYQAMKAGEVAGLDARLRVALSQQGAFSPSADAMQMQSRHAPHPDAVTISDLLCFMYSVHAISNATPNKPALFLLASHKKNKKSISSLQAPATFTTFLKTFCLGSGPQQSS